ncbi:MAG: [FeFe] hydrogenase H-cluster radical SAM maturase HydG [Gammaproteobacteria bacterium]
MTNKKYIMIINERKIIDSLEKHTKIDSGHIRAILTKALELQGLDYDEVAMLTLIRDPELTQELFHTAEKIKNIIYGKRLVIFAPLYISNFCSNDCAYCAFRKTNSGLKRRALSQNEIAAETTNLINQGHKRILLLTGEEQSDNALEYVLESIRTVYKTKTKHGEIRRLNVEIAPLTIEEFRQLKAENIGTYIVFQETYHREIYQKVHPSGKKSNYDWRIEAMDRAMQADIDDVGIGVLFGLADWRFELLALIQHAEHLNKTYGVGPHTISVPRLEPAFGSELSSNPPNPVSDENFAKLIAILRIAVPYTGIILSTRETPQTRRKALALGVSQISAGSRTNPGGYSEQKQNASQFSLGDHRSLDEVIADVASMGYIPSFCTACYRLGRTGHDFMDLAKPGKIKDMCAPNALVTFKEYLSDYASKSTKKIGEQLIQQEISTMPTKQRAFTETMLQKIENGEHDVFI